jgi:hypothetical protein
MKHYEICLLSIGSHLIPQRGYFFQDVPYKTQRGVIRTNCIDCLDRTNVVQTLYAQMMLPEQAGAVLGMSDDDEIKPLRIVPISLTTDPAFEQAFKIVWANNGDALSKQYAMTGALKSDFTRFERHQCSSTAYES